MSRVVTHAITHTQIDRILPARFLSSILSVLHFAKFNFLKISRRTVCSYIEFAGIGSTRRETPSSKRNPAVSPPASCRRSHGQTCTQRDASRASKTRISLVRERHGLRVSCSRQRSRSLSSCALSSSSEHCQRCQPDID